MTKRKKEKIEELAGIEREAAAKKILEQDKHINLLTEFELTTLLKRHEVPKPGDGKVFEQRAKWKAILESGKAAPVHEQWKVDEEEVMIRLELMQSQ